jgi:predicted aspartyl protease
MMGMFQVNVNVSNPADPTRAFERPFWVDTGALYTFVPETELHAIGLVPRFTREFVLADGRRDRRLVGEAQLQIEGFPDSITCLVVFAPRDSLFLLGATALENFALSPDPMSQTLKPITAVIGGHLTLRTPNNTR